MIHGSEVRAARPDEAEAVLETLCAAFDLNVNAARPIFYGDPFYDLSHKRVLSLHNIGIVSCLTVVPATLRIGGMPVPAGGIAGVATRPEFQRQGHAAALLAATVAALWEELHYPLSLLHPLSAPFYRRFGWETASSAVAWAADSASLPKYDTSVSVRPASYQDWPAIDALHADLTQNDTGSCVRGARRWALIQMPVPGRETYVCEDSHGLSGYAIWERGETLEVLEMHGRTPEARYGLAGLLARQPDTIVRWPASPALLAAFGFSVSSARPEPDVMLRVTDLEAALSAVHAVFYAAIMAETITALTIHATDSLCPRNRRPLRLTSHGIEPGRWDDQCWLRADIQMLGPLYLGYCLPSEAQCAGLLTTDSPQTLALADRLFPRREPYIAPLDQS